jgi:hypothetical protein
MNPMLRATVLALVLLAAAATRALADDGPGPASLDQVLASMHLAPRAWVDVAATVTPTPHGDLREARVYDDDPEGVTLQQAYLGIERTVGHSCRFDVGGKASVLVGSNAKWTHAKGLLDNQDDQEIQTDLLELYGSLWFPVVRGLTIRVGKILAPLGYESVLSPDSPLESRSFIFDFALPTTLTGVFATLDLKGGATLAYGLALGWDVWEDNNSGLTNIAGFHWDSPTKSDAIQFGVILGPEKDRNSSDVRFTMDGTWVHHWSPCWQTVLNGDFGTEEHGNPACGCDALWWGAAGYVKRTFNDRLAATLRLEIFRDEEGVRCGYAGTLSEATLGFDWTPVRCLHGLHIRPEVRWDHSLTGDFYDSGTSTDQVSLTLDAYLALP